MHVLIDHLDNARRSIRANRSRSILTVLGITIGVASVTCILAISSGVMQMITGNLDSFSDRLVVVRPDVATSDPNMIANPIYQQSFQTSSLTAKDVEELSHISDVQAVAPVMMMSGVMKSADKQLDSKLIVATNHDFSAVANITMLTGRFFDDEVLENSAVIGQQLALELFGTDRAVGQVVESYGQKLTIVGVLKRFENPINYNNFDLNQALFINLSDGIKFHDSRAQIQQIDIMASSVDSLDSVKQDISQVLGASHHGAKDFVVLSGNEISQPTSQLFRSIAGVMLVIASISLVVGGIGVMNIMLVGVAERTREIGVRKALGATSNTIVVQFLAESLTLSLLGGILGYGLGMLGAFVASVSLYFELTLDWEPVVAALAMALGVGLVFGVYPALRAARKNTIEVLRQYH